MGLTKPSECTACPDTYYCPEKGMTYSQITTGTTYQCKDGYICDTGS